MSDRKHAAALMGIFIVALAMKLFFLSSEPLIFNNDAGYYVEHISEVLSQGYPDTPDPPLAFYYAGALSSVFGIMLGFKIAISLASAAIAFPAYKIAERVSGGKVIALLAAFLAAFSPTNMLMNGDLLKNEVGLFFGAWFLYYALTASERFTLPGAAAAGLFAILMLGSHLSSGAFMALAAVPTLLYVPIMNWQDKRRLSAESWFCILFLASLVLGSLALALAKRMVGGSSIGVIGLFQAEGINAVFFTEYAIFLLPALLGIIKLERRHAALLVPWLGLGILLSQPFFTQPEFQMRFAWNAYVPMAILTASGLGYFSLDRRAFIGACLVICALTASGFARAGGEISPIIYEEEWEGLLQLQKERPDIAFSGLFGGMGQWVSAAGFEVRPDSVGTGHLLVCDASQGAENSWYAGACQMTVHDMPDEIEKAQVIAHFGRFYVVPAEAFLNKREMTPEHE